MLIDQQAAHERILFEQFKSQLDQHKGLSQQSLFPQSIDLNPSDNELMQDLLEDIQSLGFQIRSFGKNSYIIDGIPADLGTGIDERKIIEQILEDYKNNLNDFKIEKRENLAKSLARNAAIKPGTFLDNNAISELIDQLFACESPNISIFGKPIVITITLQELLEKFSKN
ncbi:DNA mismatch repair protein MutL [compost metagenome]